MSDNSAATPWMFIPGPVNVAREVLEAMAQPPINHRGKEFAALFDSLRPKVQWLMQTTGDVYLSTSSAIGLQEAAVRNCVQTRSLHLVCGAFSEAWFRIAGDCGKNADAQEVEWGLANRPETLRTALASGRYDTVCVVHSETSTSVQNPLEDIASVMREFPEVIFCVDAVSSLAAAPVYVDAWGIDICFASVQKGLALPPGFSVFSVSPKAMERARGTPGRGYYFDFLMFESYARKSQTPTTPSISHMYALDTQLDRMAAEGFENRWNRHAQMAQMTQAWADSQFACYAEAPFRSAAVTAVKNTRGMDVAALNRHLSGLGKVIAPGYGKIKSGTFRIGHVGETQISQLRELLAEIDRYLVKGRATGRA